MTHFLFNNTLIAFLESIVLLILSLQHIWAFHLGKIATLLFDNKQRLDI